MNEINLPTIFIMVHMFGYSEEKDFKQKICISTEK